MDLGELSNFRTESGRHSVTVGDWFQEPPHTNIPRCSSPLYKTAEYNEYSWHSISTHRYGVPTVYLLEKKNLCIEWICIAQTHVVQGSTECKHGPWMEGWEVILQSEVP